MSYIPLTAGLYTLMLRYGGQPAAGFPTSVNVLPAVDTSKVKVFGPGVDDKGRNTQPSLRYSSTASFSFSSSPSSSLLFVCVCVCVWM